MTKASPKAETGTLDLWHAVETTDPHFTKAFTRGGGFKGTATNATYQARKATEMFGPCGLGWGWTVLSEEILEGVDGTKVHKILLRLWYEWQGKRGEIEQFGQTEFSGKRSSGNTYTDEEAPKKSLTDAVSKCLSLLGFSADIHMGLYDDNKYVAELKRQFGSGGPAKGAPARTPAFDSITDLLAAIREAPSDAVLTAITTHDGNVAFFNALGADEQNGILDAVDARRAELAGAKPAKAKEPAHKPEPLKPTGGGHVEAGGYDEADSAAARQLMLKDLTAIAKALEAENAKRNPDLPGIKQKLVEWGKKHAREKVLLTEGDKAVVTTEFNTVQADLRAAREARG